MCAKIDDEKQKEVLTARAQVHRKRFSEGDFARVSRRKENREKERVARKAGTKYEVLSVLKLDLEERTGDFRTAASRINRSRENRSNSSEEFPQENCCRRYCARA